MLYKPNRKKINKERCVFLHNHFPSLSGINRTADFFSSQLDFGGFSGALLTRYLPLPPRADCSEHCHIINHGRGVDRTRSSLIYPGYYGSKANEFCCSAPQPNVLYAYVSSATHCSHCLFRISWSCFLLSLTMKNDVRSLRRTFWRNVRYGQTQKRGPPTGCGSYTHIIKYASKLQQIIRWFWQELTRAIAAIRNSAFTGLDIST